MWPDKGRVFSFFSEWLYLFDYGDNASQALWYVDNLPYGRIKPAWWLLMSTENIFFAFLFQVKQQSYSDSCQIVWRRTTISPDEQKIRREFQKSPVATCPIFFYALKGFTDILTDSCETGFTQLPKDTLKTIAMSGALIATVNTEGRKRHSWMFL